MANKKIRACVACGQEMKHYTSWGAAKLHGHDACNTKECARYGLLSAVYLETERDATESEIAEDQRFSRVFNYVNAISAARDTDYM